MLLAILVKYHGYIACREKSKRRKTSIRQKNWRGVGKWRRLGAAFCKNWLLGVSSTKQQEHSLARLHMVRPCMVRATRMWGIAFNAFVDAESSAARRARFQQYYAPEGNRTTFHHYVPTNGSKVKSSQPVPLTGLILLTSPYHQLSDYTHSSQCHC